MCGGDIESMLPESCDPGYGLLGIALGAPTLAKQAALFGYNATPPIDLPQAWVATPFFPSASSLTPPNQALLAYSAIGQLNDTASALSNALVAAGIANDGVIMRPYLVQQIRDDQGAIVTTHQPAPWMTAASPRARGQRDGADEVGGHAGHGGPSRVPPVARRRREDRHRADGRPQRQYGRLDDRLCPGQRSTDRGRRCRSLQNFVDTGAGVAGPIMKAMLEAALAPAAK